MAQNAWAQSYVHRLPTEIMKSKCERVAPLSPEYQHMGLTGGELLGALATEGATNLMEKRPMDILMKIMMGGWIPAGSRSQWTAFLVAMVAMINATMAWGTGDMAFMDFLKEVQAQWLVFANAYAIYFLGEKIDGKK
jgi:hypothetical protein